MRFKIVTATPNKSNNIAYEVMDCVEYIKSSKAFKNYNIVAITSFIDANSETDYNNKINVIKSIFDLELDYKSDISFLAQKPMIDGSVAFELHLIHKEDGDVYIEELYGTKYSKVIFSSGEFMLFIPSKSSTYRYGIDRAVDIVFDKVKLILTENNLNFSNVFRQWNYIENITKKVDGKQNYQVFNSIRTKYYKPYFEHNFNGYPAATGIGIKYGGFQMSLYAASNKFEFNSVVNKLQTEAYSYSENVLVKGKKTPKFDRAKTYKDLIFISGTASIRGEKTIGNNTWNQHNITNENIGILMVGGENDYNLDYTRTYIKQEKYNNAVEQNLICKRNLTVVADICRDDLLVEIEGFGKKIEL